MLKQLFLAGTIALSGCAHQQHEFTPITVEPPDYTATRDSLYEEYNLEAYPELVFSILPHDYSGSQTEEALYYSDEHRLELNLQAIRKEAERTQKPIEEITDRVFKHELGHHKANIVSEEITNNHFPDYTEISEETVGTYETLLEMKQFGKFDALFDLRFRGFVDEHREELTSYVLQRLVSEGIAVHHEGNPPKTVTWPKSIFHIVTYEDYRRFAYHNGHALTHEILEEYPERGLEYLVQNVPTSFQELPEYTKKAFTTLEEESVADSISTAFHLDEYPNLTVSASSEVSPYLPLAGYNPVTNNMIVYYKNTRVEILFNNFLPQVFRDILTPLSMHIAHELGHHKVDLIAENEGIEELVNPTRFGPIRREHHKALINNYSDTLSNELQQLIRERGPELQEYLLWSVVQEGIATHFEVNKQLPPTDQKYYDATDIVSHNNLVTFLYQEGHSIVHPILSVDEREGILFLLQNPLTSFRRDSIEAYQERAVIGVRENFLADSLTTALNLKEKYPDHTLKVSLEQEPLGYAAYYYGTMTTTIYWESFEKARNNPSMRELGIEETIKHEIAHYFTDNIERRLGTTLFPFLHENYGLDTLYKQTLTPQESLFDNEEQHAERINSFVDQHPELLEYVITRQLIEGIAEYYARDGEPPRDYVWIDDIRSIRSVNFYNHLIYNSGYHLVQPIIDEYGEQGIAYLLQNPPTPEEFYDRGLYTTLALLRLGEKK